MSGHPIKLSGGRELQTIGGVSVHLIMWFRAALESEGQPVTHVARAPSAMR